jgi:Spy/CpxP family protein refolding chaperone
MTNYRALKTFIGLLTAAITISGSALLVVESAIAQPAGHTRMDPAQMDTMVERHVERMSKAVNATPEQKAKLLIIAKSAQADVLPMHEKIRTRMDLAMTQSKEVLTPEQRTQWDASMKSRMSRRADSPMKKHD